METVNILIRGQQKQIPVAYVPEAGSTDALKDRAQAFIDTLGADNLLKKIASEIIDDAYSQSGTQADPAEYTQLFQDLKIKSLEFGEEEVMMLLDAQGVGVTCQLSYDPAGEIENLELDL